jgi:nucleoside 2-deoxyribosyltransferase
MKVYVSGPIYIDDKKASDEWREDAAKILGNEGIHTIDPCRAKATYRVEYFTPNEIIFRDLRDIQHADLIYVNLLNLKPGKLPIGTVMEIMYAWDLKKPVVLAATDPRITKHPWILAMTVKQFNDQKSAVNYIVDFWKET